MFNKNLVFLFSVLITTGLLSCGGEKKQAGTSGEFDSAASSIQNQVQNVLYEIPPPSEIPYIIQATGADYNRDLVNKLEKQEKYLATQKIAALNLGVYATDIGYLVSYDQVQDALNYMKGCLDIGENLGLKSALDITIVNRFQSNLNAKDSLANIINQVISNSDRYLKDAERDNIAALVVAGTFIEGLYLSSQLVARYPKDILNDQSRNLVLTPLIKIILDQEKPLGDIINLLRSIDLKDDWIDGLINSMDELKKNYTELNIQEQIRNNRADLALSDKTLERITIQIEKIRTTVTY
ncbi:MAG TPA: hypothetical protein VI583_11150 [Cyclobacteriaceae bacterium]|nr:hypothetical protein [Cyclobacteriaceae bacterium]